MLVLSRKRNEQLVIRIGDQMIDGSAKARLGELVSQLLSA